MDAEARSSSGRCAGVQVFRQDASLTDPSSPANMLKAVVLIGGPQKGENKSPRRRVFRASEPRLVEDKLGC